MIIVSHIQNTINTFIYSLNKIPHILDYAMEIANTAGMKGRLLGCSCSNRGRELCKWLQGYSFYFKPICEK